MANILVILGHPNIASLCSALASTYAEAAQASGHSVRLIVLADLQFDPILRAGFSAKQPLEPDLVAAQENITWAQHLVVVYPIWWAAPPALLKGFFDRAFLPGFAFKYRENSPMWDKYLTGKTARLLVTSDSPKWYLFWITRNPAVRAVKQGTLEFCGITPVQVTICPMVRKSTPAQRTAWLEEARRLGSLGA